MKRPRARRGPSETPRGVRPLAFAATLACVLEASAEKVGNVTPTHAFADARFADFVGAAVALGPAMTQARPGRVGWAIWKAVQATRRVAPSNTHLVALRPEVVAENREPTRRRKGPDVVPGAEVDEHAPRYLEAVDLRVAPPKCGFSVRKAQSFPE